MRSRSAPQCLQATSGYRGHPAAERLHLGDHGRQRAADDLADGFRIRHCAPAERADLGEQHRDGPQFLARRWLGHRWPGQCWPGQWPLGGRRPGRWTRGDAACLIEVDHRRVQLVQGGRGVQPQAGQGGGAPLVAANRHLTAALPQESAQQRACGLLAGRVMLEGRPPGGEGRVASLRTVAGQREPRLLAQRLQVLPRQHRPVGVGLIGQQDAFVGEGVDQGAFAFGAGSHRERPRKRGLLLIHVHLRVGRRPDVGEVGLQHRGRRLAEFRERRPGHRQRLGQCPRGRTRFRAGEQRFAGEVPRDPAARADQHKLAQPPCRRAGPRAGGLRVVRGGHGEWPEHADADMGYRWSRRCSAGQLSAGLPRARLRRRHTIIVTPAGTAFPTVVP